MSKYRGQFQSNVADDIMDWEDDVYNAFDIDEEMDFDEPDSLHAKERRHLAIPISKADPKSHEEFVTDSLYDFDLEELFSDNEFDGHHP